MLLSYDEHFTSYDASITLVILICYRAEIEHLQQQVNRERERYQNAAAAPAPNARTGAQNGQSSGPQMVSAIPKLNINDR